jgi:hypothetical protein
VTRAGDRGEGRPCGGICSATLRHLYEFSSTGFEGAVHQQPYDYSTGLLWHDHDEIISPFRMWMFLFAVVRRDQRV